MNENKEHSEPRTTEGPWGPIRPLMQGDEPRMTDCGHTADPATDEDIAYCHELLRRPDNAGLAEAGWYVAPLLARIEAEAAQGAAQGAAPLTDWERSQLPRHTDDGNGGCIVCREWDGTFGEDDEMPTTIVSWPCAKVRLAARGAAPRAEGLDVPTGVERIRHEFLRRGWSIHMPDNEYAVLDAWAFLARLLSRPSDEHVPESEEPR